jgi:hypothetical protein
MIHQLLNLQPRVTGVAARIQGLRAFVSAYAISLSLYVRTYGVLTLQIRAPLTRIPENAQRSAIFDPFSAQDAAVP